MCSPWVRHRGGNPCRGSEAKREREMRRIREEDSEIETEDVEEQGKKGYALRVETGGTEEEVAENL